MRRLKQRRRATGEITPRPCRNHRQPLLAPHWERLQQQVAARPDATLDELRQALRLKVSKPTLCRALQQLRLTIKTILHASEQDRPDVAERRARWLAERTGVDPRRLVFIDETWASTNLTRRYGRALCGTRLITKVPHGHWLTTTLVAALRYDGLEAPLVLDGPLDGASFRAYVEQHLAPVLRPGDVVIMDHLACHKVAGVQEAIAAGGARAVYLPPYSPDLNPIEQVFAKFKHLLRSSAQRTLPALWSAMRRMLRKFSAEECPHYFRHCGYTL